MKKMYQADAAQKQYKKQYKSTLREARIGISLTDEQLSFLEETIVPLLKNGLSIPACYEAYADSMPRGSLNARASIQLFVELYGKEAAAKLGLKYIPFDQLCLKPNLLTK